METNKAHLMTGYSDNRQPYDLYHTPPSATIALFRTGEFDKKKTILEPSCGAGYLSEAAKSLGYKVSSYDLNYFSYGTGGVDFLTHNKEFYNNPPYVITNPPYKFATEFIMHAKEVASEKVAMLLKLNSIAGLDRYKKVWTDKEFPAKRVVVFVKRLDFMLKSSPTLEYCWVIWEKYYMGPTQLSWDMDYV